MFETLTFMILVLPGFIASATRRVFAGRRPSTWQETALVALVFDLPIFGLVYGISLLFKGLPQINIFFEPFSAALMGFYITYISIAVVVALCLGFVAGLAAKAGGIYGLLFRFSSLRTHETGKADIWEEVFTDRDCQGKWVSVYLKSGVCYNGWPQYFGTADKPGLFLARYKDWRVAKWPTASPDNQAEIKGPGVFIPDIAEIGVIEILDGEDE